ncbi:F-box/LRR-repeat protein 25-like isoform X2 [Euphorbia lathyris]|uniref:F-box/LRR-repeat protein 25-like isoform X2 n=1 Tax=Euphorbia lathyris TaxID=212925 RepID=UPI0033140701
MEGTAGASMVESDGTCESDNGNKIFKSHDEEDRITALPDFLIHHILSFLPATDLVRTLVLSKSWKYQWTHVPVLKFVLNAGMSPDQFSNFIDKTLILHDCSNIEKFVIKWKSSPAFDEFLNLDLWIRYAVTKDVKELIVKMGVDKFLNLLPEFLFNNSSLVKLKISSCYFAPSEKVNWGSVKSLRLHRCEVANGGIGNVLSSTPMLEYLELFACYLDEGVVIASKSVKTLILDSVDCDFSNIEISCPNLERLRISGLVWFTSLKLVNLPSSVYATLDFLCCKTDESEDYMSHEDCINLAHQTIRQVQHVQKLEIGRWLMDSIIL